MADLFKMKQEDVMADFPIFQFYDLQDNLKFFGTANKPGLIYTASMRAAQLYVDHRTMGKMPDFTKIIDPTFITKLRAR